MDRVSLGIAATCYLSVWETLDTLPFLERANRFGAAGIQAVLREDPLKVRARTEELGMYFEAMVPLPMDGETSEFEQSLRNAQLAGATAVRAACLGTRRYESFSTFEDWRAHVGRSMQSLADAVPVLEKYKIPLGLENHKDWTADELLEILSRFSSEYLGVCLDFGNNISLLDSPLETIEKLAPYTVVTHLKDMAADLYEEGILLSEVVLGRGFVDLPRAIRLIRDARPQTRMTLEMITRNPLRVPMLTESYWATLPNKKAAELARTLRFVREHRGKDPLPSVQDGDSSALEDRNVRDCLAVWPTLALDGA